MAKPLYMPMYERRKVIASYAEKYGLKVLVETGTFLGETPLALRDRFDEIWTIELHRRMYEEACKKLEPYPHVHCVQGDSQAMLRVVIAKLSEPALFWLDGHYSGPGTGRGRIDTPIRKELEVIFADGRSHVILIDDARLFEGGPEHTEEYKDYPSLKWVETVADQNGYDYSLKDDIIRLTPRSADT